MSVDSSGGSPRIYGGSNALASRKMTGENFNAGFRLALKPALKRKKEDMDSTANSRSAKALLAPAKAGGSHQLRKFSK